MPSQCHLSSPWPLQIYLAHLPSVHSSFVETYHVTLCLSCSASQSRRLVILPWLAAIETHQNMILQTTSDKDMTALDTTKNIAYMHICQVISSANYSIIYF